MYFVLVESTRDRLSHGIAQNVCCRACSLYGYDFEHFGRPVRSVPFLEEGLELTHAYLVADFEFRASSNTFRCGGCRGFIRGERQTRR